MPADILVSEPRLTLTVDDLRIDLGGLELDDGMIRSNMVGS
jgi:hypothetical protein